MSSDEMLADGTYDGEALATTADRQVAGDRLLRPARRADRGRAWTTWSAPAHFVDNEVLPVINGYWERAEFPWELIKKMGALGIVGDGIDGYGCPAMSPVAAGLINMELNRGDGSLGTFLAVQAGLAMRSIWMLGSEEQKQRWLPGMADVGPAGGVRADRAGTRLGRGGAGDDRNAATATATSSTVRSAGSATAPWPT